MKEWSHTNSSMCVVSETMSCSCGSPTAEKSEIDLAVDAITAASAAALDGIVARLDGLDAIITQLVPTADGDDPELDADGVPVTAAPASGPADTADSRVRELENRVGQIEESLSALIVESTPAIEELVS